MSFTALLGPIYDDYENRIPLIFILNIFQLVRLNTCYFFLKYCSAVISDDFYTSIRNVKLLH